MSVQPRSESVFCGNCGTQNPAGQKFCSKCGAPLAAAPNTQGAQVYQAPPTAPAVPVAQPKKRGRFLRGCLIAFGALILLGVLARAFGGGTTNRANTTGQAASQAAVSTAAQASATSTASVTSGAPAASQAPASEAPAASQAPAAYPVGQDVQVGEVRWKILEAKDEGQTLKSGNQFIKDKTTGGKFVRVKFEMENLSKDMLSFAGLDLVDAENRTFKPFSEGFQFVPTDQACVLENLNPNVPKACEVIYELPGNATGVKAKVGDLKIFGNKEALIDLGF